MSIELITESEFSKYVTKTYTGITREIAWYKSNTLDLVGVLLGHHEHRAVGRKLDLRRHRSVAAERLARVGNRGQRVAGHLEASDVRRREVIADVEHVHHAVRLGDAHRPQSARQDLELQGQVLQQRAHGWKLFVAAVLRQKCRTL